jgi:ribosomal protein L24E
VELDELNRLFTSKNVEDVIKFYDHFDTAEQLIEWMKNRPSAPMKIYEVEGEKDIVVVIPTANHEGDFAKNCANNIFKGQQIVFVESNGPFFNFARSCNYGLKYALKYNPKWIVLSNDDITRIGSTKLLKDKLFNVVGDIISVKATNTGHFYDYYFVKSTFFFKIFNSLKRRNINYILSKFEVLYFGRTYRHKFFDRVFYKKITTIPLNSAFLVFSQEFLSSKNGLVFDEICINSCEDLLIWLENSTVKLVSIDIPIEDLVGSSLGNSSARLLRDLNGLIYFNYEYKKRM